RVDGLEGRRADGTALTGTFDHKQTVVDLAGPGHELGQVLESGEDTDVGRLVDDGLDAQGPSFLQVLLHAAVLVGEVDVDVGARAEDPGLRRQRGPGTSSGGDEDGPDLLRTADTDVVADERLEEPPGAPGVVEHKGAGDFHLAHGQLPEVAGSLVVGGERCGDDRAPAVEESLDVCRSEPVADALKASRVLARGEPVRQLTEAEVFS